MGVAACRRRCGTAGRVGDRPPVAATTTITAGQAGGCGRQYAGGGCRWSVDGCRRGYPVRGGGSGGGHSSWRPLLPSPPSAAGCPRPPPRGPPLAHGHSGGGSTPGSGVSGCVGDGRGGERGAGGAGGAGGGAGPGAPRPPAHADGLGCGVWRGGTPSCPEWRRGWGGGRGSGGGPELVGGGRGGRRWLRGRGRSCGSRGCRGRRGWVICRRRCGRRDGHHGHRRDAAAAAGGGSGGAVGGRRGGSDARVACPPSRPAPPPRRCDRPRGRCCPRGHGVLARHAAPVDGAAAGGAGAALPDWWRVGPCRLGRPAVACLSLAGPPRSGEGDDAVRRRRPGRHARPVAADSYWGGAGVGCYGGCAGHGTSGGGRDGGASGTGGYGDSTRCDVWGASSSADVGRSAGAGTCSFRGRGDWSDSLGTG